MEYRPLANTGLKISEVALGCWPIAGMTSPGVNDADSIATIQACFELGINHLDTAYMYGRYGESERLIARALGNRRHEMVIATKCGLHWSSESHHTSDARPATLRKLNAGVFADQLQQIFVARHDQYITASVFGLLCYRANHIVGFVSL